MTEITGENWALCGLLAAGLLLVLGLAVVIEWGGGVWLAFRAWWSRRQFRARMVPKGRVW